MPWNGSAPSGGQPFNAAPYVALGATDIVRQRGIGITGQIKVAHMAESMGVPVHEVDAAEDALYGPDKTGDELPEELADPTRRLQKIQEAKAALETEAKSKGKDEPAAITTSSSPSAMTRSSKPTWACSPNRPRKSSTAAANSSSPTASPASPGVTGR